MGRVIHILLSVMAMATHFYAVFTYPTSPPTMRLFLQSPQQVITKFNLISKMQELRETKIDFNFHASKKIYK